MKQNNYLFGSSILEKSEDYLMLSESSLITNGKATEEKDCIRVYFDRTGDVSDVFITTIKLDHIEELSGTAACIKLEKWERIDYIALGVMTGREFKHIKINHIRQNIETLIEVSLHGLAYKIQNGFFLPVTLPCDSIRIFIKGMPAKETAALSIFDAVVFNEGEKEDFRLTFEDKNYPFSQFKSAFKDYRSQMVAISDLRKALLDYDKRVFPDFKKSAEFYLEGNGLSLAKYADISVPIIESLINVIQDNNTLRYSYHALNHINSLLMLFECTHDDTALYSARELLSVWESANFSSNAPEDARYTWYDHGTAERLLVMVRFWSIGIDKKFDTRFMGRLLYMIKQHADLLANESFYARNQNYRYHNHGLFQDIALLATSLAFPFITVSSVWQVRSLERIKDQFDHLIIHENGTAILKENSPGYHDGTIRIVAFVNELLRCSDNNDALIFFVDLEAKMLAFSKLMHYPGGRQPAIGDTFRIENSASTREKSLVGIIQDGFYSYPNAGYIIAKGHEKEAFWQFTMVGSSLTKTHKHEDNLSFTLFFDGIEWFTDPSFFSHQYTDIFPAYFRSAKAHNAVVIDNIAYSIETDITDLSTSYVDNRFHIVGKHNAYEGIEIKRSVVGTLSELHLEFNDEVVCSAGLSHHDIVSTTYWHLGESVGAQKIDNGFVLYSSLSPFRLKLTSKEFNDWTIIQGNDDNVPEGWIGSGFCMALPSQTIVCYWSSPRTVWSISLEE